MSPSNRASSNPGPWLYPHVSSSSGTILIYIANININFAFNGVHLQWLVKKALETRGEREAANRAYSLRWFQFLLSQVITNFRSSVNWFSIVLFVENAKPLLHLPSIDKRREFSKEHGSSLLENKQLKNLLVEFEVAVFNWRPCIIAQIMTI